ncbi:uncharacterized protein LOC125207337 isoform X2 [Salvia hispanica]|uniref:uncharacterized protein LOC125207337 isoform X2 n=1 Tax=Salvia hispanica TaxID=49212 RepID=UPI0020098EF7|nr:uncharacterized protein LOC125207337 isoform X2 [Salvia hispanica]
MCSVTKFCDKVYMMAEGGSQYCSKKSDDICDEDSGKSSSMTRLKCFLRGLDIKAYLFLFMLIPTSLFFIYVHGQKITYFLRPLWESPPKPFHEIPHYYHENVSMENLCKLHGWGIREYPRRVFDAVLFSNELDILKIRWNELYPYVSEFVLLESNSTFTGLPKPFVFAGFRDEFKFLESRLTYGQVPGRFKKGENPFIEEAYQRLALDYLLKQAGIQDDDLLIMSDVDEIPSRHTINLLRWCDGWHCSFCFRRIKEFVFKMKAYSHVDRVRFSHFLNPKRVQRVICKGADLFDMLPEEYTFKEIIGKMGPVPHSYSAVHLPAYLLENADQFKFLLPGNCLRESG